MFSFIGEILAGIGRWFWKTLTPAGKAIVILIVILLISAGVAGFFLWKEYRSTQTELQQEKEARATEHQIDIDESKQQANNSANLSNQAMQNVNKVENANFANTNLNDAERARCRAFPERCKK